MSNSTILLDSSCTSIEFLIDVVLKRYFLYFNLKKKIDVHMLRSCYLGVASSASEVVMLVKIIYIYIYLYSVVLRQLKMVYC